MIDLSIWRVHRRRMGPTRAEDPVGILFSGLLPNELQIHSIEKSVGLNFVENLRKRILVSKSRL